MPSSLVDKVHWFHMGPWPVHVGFTQSEKAFRRALKRMKVDDPLRFVLPGCGAKVTDLTDNKGGSTFIISLQPNSADITRDQQAAMLAHEAVHIIQWMKEYLGNLGEEAEAYLVQYITQECLACVPREADNAGV